MSEKTCCPAALSLTPVHKTVEYCSAAALSTVLLTQTELSITVREVALTQRELWTFGRAPPSKGRE